MKSTILLVLLLTLVSCASKRTKYSDKNMRVMIDTEGLDMADYNNLQSALVRSNVWTVLDRSRGLAAVKREQEELHKYNHDRYDAREKFAHWGKLYGVGSVIVGHSECHNRPNTWNMSQLKNYCKMYLSLVDANTGEVLVSVNGEDAADFMARPDWSDLVAELIETYPKYFEEKQTDQRLLDYKKESLANSNKMDRKFER